MGLDYDYILVIDTETSGLPKTWNRPYTDSENWPYIAQISWLVYQYRSQKEMTRHNFYVAPDGFELTTKSTEIHGLDINFLQEHGTPRATIMQQLKQDLEKYNPLIVSHFLQLDYHMMRLGFHRAGLPNVLTGKVGFCTMLITENFLRITEQRYLRLDQLYAYLFSEPMNSQHDALADALATAKCFFELSRKGDITNRSVKKQQGKHTFRNDITLAKRRKKLLPGAILILIALLIFLLWKIFLPGS